MKQKKLLLIALLLLPFKIVNAININASISVTPSSTVKGNSGKSILTITSDKRISATEGTFDCGELGNLDLGWSASNISDATTSKTFSFNWTAKTPGTHTCKIIGLKAGSFDDLDSGMVSVNVANKTVTVIENTSNNKQNNNNEKKSNDNTTAEKKEYDSDNNLKSLEIENYKIYPDFNKDTAEYRLEVDESVEKINVKATKNSEKAEIIGVGEKNLTPGDNTIEVKVIAENGNEKIYKILVTVKDQNPIILTINGKRYNVVKKNNNILEKLENYEEETIKIEDQDVVSYINKTTNTRLVILKDENNQPGYYIYNEKTKKYTKYRTITIGNITLQLLEAPVKLKYYKKYNLNIKNETVDIYKIKDSHKVGLIYGTNIKTGNTGYYVYDQNEETLSKYYDEEVKVINNEFLDFKNKAMIFMGVVSGIVIIMIITSICKEIKRKKKRNHY